VGQGHLWQGIVENHFYRYGPESFETTQRLLLKEKIKDASGQNQVPLHFSNE
jgi:hypothetical protein